MVKGTVDIYGIKNLRFIVNMALVYFFTINENESIEFPKILWPYPYFFNQNKFFFNFHLGYSLYFMVVCLCHIITVDTIWNIGETGDIYYCFVTLNNIQIDKCKKMQMGTYDIRHNFIIWILI